MERTLNILANTIEGMAADAEDAGKEDFAITMTQADAKAICKGLNLLGRETEAKCSCKPYSPYEDTVPLMLSPDYKDHHVAEYRQTKLRYEKLKVICDRIEMAETHPKKVEMPPHDCNIDLLRSQLYHMRNYLDILEKRAIVEGICLD